MNNEEKILQMLESITERIDGMQNDITEIKEEQRSFKTQIQENINMLRKEISLEIRNVTDFLFEKSATREDVRHIENKIDILNKDFFDQRATIAELKRIK